MMINNGHLEGFMKIIGSERVGIIGLVAIIAIFVSVTVASEKRVQLKDLPDPVRAAAQKVTTGGALKHIDLERKDGQDTYAVEANMGGKNKEFTFAADGTLLAEEEDIAFADVPPAGRTAAEHYFGGSSGLHASKELAAGVTSYEVEGKKGGKPISLKLNASGALIEEEAEEKDHDD